MKKNTKRIANLSNTTRLSADIHTNAHPLLTCNAIPYEPWELLPSGVLAAHAVKRYATKHNSSLWRRQLCAKYLERWAPGPQVDRVYRPLKAFDDGETITAKLPKELLECLDTIGNSRADGIRRCVRHYKALNSAPETLGTCNIGTPTKGGPYAVLTHMRSPIFACRIYRGDKVPSAWLEHSETMRLDKGWYATHFHWFYDEGITPDNRHYLFGLVNNAVNRWRVRQAGPRLKWKESIAKRKNPQRKKPPMTKAECIAKARKVKLQKATARKKAEAKRRAMGMPPRPRPAKRAPKRRSITTD